MRLIDADNMLNMVDLLNDRVYSKREITAMINTRSTVYDIDKVVEEIFDDDFVRYDDDFVIPRDRAIEIVKQGLKE